MKHDRGALFWENYRWSVKRGCAEVSNPQLTVTAKSPHHSTSRILEGAEASLDSR
jgi:hypothetical protein